jgi:hypothetical protein
MLLWIVSTMTASLGGINIPKRETEGEDENPGNSKSLTDLVITLGEILGEDHDENHVDGQSN